MVDLLIAIIGRFGKPALVLILTVCAILVTLSVIGVISPNSSLESTADEIFKDETGFDLEKAEEEVLKR